jgi:hypothetical protein
MALVYEYRKNDQINAGEIAKKILSLYPGNMYAQLIAAKNDKDESQS